MKTDGPTLSTGKPSTLGNWLELTTAFFGACSPATRYIGDKMREQGPEEQVIADEGQLLSFLTDLHGESPLVMAKLTERT